MNYSNSRRPHSELTPISFAATAMVTLGLLSSWAQQAQAAVNGSSVTVTLGNGDSIDIPLTPSLDKPGAFDFDFQTRGFVNGSQVGTANGLEELPADNLAEFSITGTLNPDPSIFYGIAVIDTGGPSLFNFSFTTPIVPVGFPNTVSASISGALTDATGNGVSITPALASGFVQDALVGVPDTGFSSLGTLASFGAGLPGAFYIYGPFSFGPAPGPGPGPWTTLTLNNSFTLSGSSDIAVLTGFASIVPEPTSCSLLILGAAALLGVARRRRV